MARPQSRRRPSRLRAVLFRCLAVALLLIAVPGAQEVVEDAVHYLHDGHTAHDAGHQQEQPDHCCSGLFHVCSCHAQTHATPAVMHELALAPSVHEIPFFVAAPMQAAHGYRAPPFRPPAS